MQSKNKNPKKTKTCSYVLMYKQHATRLYSQFKNVHYDILQSEQAHHIQQHYCQIPL